MITPSFKITQSEDFLFIEIKAPCAKLNELDVFVDENDFRFYCKPYFLVVHLPGSVLENSDDDVVYDFEESLFKIKFEKKNSGECFEGFEYITKILTPSRKKTPPIIETAQQEINNEETDNNNEEEEDEDEDEDEDVDEEENKEDHYSNEEAISDEAHNEEESSEEHTDNKDEETTEEYNNVYNGNEEEQQIDEENDQEEPKDTEENKEEQANLNENIQIGPNENGIVEEEQQKQDDDDDEDEDEDDYEDEDEDEDDNVNEDENENNDVEEEKIFNEITEENNSNEISQEQENVEVKDTQDSSSKQEDTTEAEEYYYCTSVDYDETNNDEKDNVAENSNKETYLNNAQEINYQKLKDYDHSTSNEVEYCESINEETENPQKNFEETEEYQEKPDNNENLSQNNQVMVEETENSQETNEEIFDQKNHLKEEISENLQEILNENQVSEETEEQLNKINEDQQINEENTQNNQIDEDEITYKETFEEVEEKEVNTYNEDEEDEEGEEEDNDDDDDDGCEWFIEKKANNDDSFGFNFCSYGFAQTKLNVFSSLSEEYQFVIDLPNPDSNREDRTKLRIEDEKQKFNDDHYLANFFDEEEIIEILKYTPTYDNEYTDAEIDILKNLPKRAYFLTKEEKFYAFSGLIDILFAYCYDRRINCGYYNSESAWTIVKLSSTLSWFDTFNCLQDVLVASYRRSLCYPLYRNWKLNQMVFKDLIDLLKQGLIQIIKSLIYIRKSFLDNCETRYILNDLYIDDYIIWIQYVNTKILNSLISSMEFIQITKQMVDLDLECLEICGQLALDNENRSDWDAQSVNNRRSPSSSSTLDEEDDYDNDNIDLDFDFDTFNLDDNLSKYTPNNLESN